MTEHRFPGIAKATIEMAYDNGGVHRERREHDVLRDLDTVLNDGVAIAFNLSEIDKWLATLSDDDLQIAVAGEETEREQLMGTAPPGTDALLDEIFERAA